MSPARSVRSRAATARPQLANSPQGAQPRIRHVGTFWHMLARAAFLGLGLRLDFGALKHFLCSPPQDAMRIPRGSPGSP